MRLATQTLVFVGLTALLSASCGGHDDHTHDRHEGHGEGGAGVAGADTYHAGLERTGEQGLVVVRLMDSDPVPQDTGLYTWVLAIEDSSGAPVTDAIVVATPIMPAHGHGTFPATTTSVVGDAPGEYRLEEMDLFMAGIWQVTLRVSLADGASDALEFNFHLEG